MKFKCYLKARPVFPYIAIVDAKNKTHAARLFLDDIKDYRNARSSVGTVGAVELGKKESTNGWRMI